MTSTAGGIAAATVTLNGAVTPYTCTGYRLPTESEWEYAYRAGGLSAFYTSEGNDGSIASGDADVNAEKIAWYMYNDGTVEKPGGGKAANAWGVFDAAGNVYEWCWDISDTYPAASIESPAIDPVGAISGTDRIMRGGSWYSAAPALRAATRQNYTPDFRYRWLGFRLVRTLAP